ncbi:MAG: DNA repair protein RecO [Chloroflexi bacterium]|nr:DNA repair protein RecO [Chloroflexota bacterium]
MSRPHLFNTEALVLRSTELGEADRLLTLLTPAYGKLHATARGVRKATSKLGGHLDILTRASLTISHGQSLDTVSGAEALEPFMALKADLRALSKALYLAELADAFHPPESPNPQAYALFLETLRVLESSEDHDLALRCFEVQLLGLCGFQPHLSSCVQCDEPLQPGRHFLSPAAGGILCPACCPAYSDAAPISVHALKVLRYLASNPLATALRVNVKAGLHRELAALTGGFLRHVLERELRSTAFLRSVTQQAARLEEQQTSHR